MSELQNRIVERLGALDPLRQVALTPDKRERLMTAAIACSTPQEEMQLS